MPYLIEKRGDQWCVVTEGTGKTHGCHETRGEAIKQQRALYKNAPPSEEASGQRKIAFYLEMLKAMVSSDGAPTLEDMSEAVIEDTAAEAPAAIWEGPLALVGAPTDDKRFLMEADHRELPLSLMAQIETADGHDGARLAARIDEIWTVDTKDDQGRTVTQIWGRGPFDSSEYGQEIARLVEEEFLTGVSIDFAAKESFLLDPETYDVIDAEEMGLEDLLDGDYLTGLKGTIMGATLVPFPAFAETRVSVVTASAGRVIRDHDEVLTVRERFQALVATAGPVKPPYDWFKDPYLTGLTPLTITKEGRVYGHLADWDGCHTGFQGVCVPPFRSMSDYAFFNVGEIETAEGELVPCGKLMFSMDGGKHATTDDYLGYEEVMQHYDDATKVGAFVRAGADKFGTWLAGSLRPGLSEEEIQHLRTHPPSGDWRPIKNGPSDLVAAFSVPVPGFPIARGRALVASAGGEITAIISGPLELDEEMGYRRRRRKKAMLGIRLREALGAKSVTKAEIRAARMREQRESESA